MTARRAATYSINALLVLLIAFIIGATWLPAIYVSPSFQSNPWVRVHFLGLPATAPAHK
jgi:hypothetical protein